MTMLILVFRPVAVAATSATVVGAVLIFAAMMTDLSEKQTAEYDQPTFLSLSLAFGTIAFSFGGMSTFPTTQNDMQYPQKFPRSVALAYLGKFHFILTFASIFSPRQRARSAADPGFPRGGGANSPGGGGAPTYDFAKFSRKLHEIERIWAPVGGGGEGAPLAPPLNPPLQINSLTYRKIALQKQLVDRCSSLVGPLVKRVQNHIA